MGKKNKARSKNINSPQPPASTLKKLNRERKKSYLPWLFLVMGITAIALFPMLKNGFTNWDDEFYVMQNALLRGPDWNGIFTQQVNDNYHPLTIVSLAVNYGISGLDASSYLLFNFILHLLNTALVFYFIYQISDKKTGVAFLTALIFGIHPMHVESVAWISERKDVLYTLFFLWSLIEYWKYLQTNKPVKYGTCLLFFALSLLSKPAAIILPLVLFLLDYWEGRPFNKKLILEKIPFLILSLLFAVVTLQIQSHKAIIGLDVFPIWQRLLFACYGTMIYLFRFFIPYPLSAFHPFPSPDNLGWPVTISPLIVIALIVFMLYQRENKLIIFSILFYIVNLLLVLQVVSIGNTIVAERYTYVPYIGLSFLFSMWLNNFINRSSKKLLWIVPAFIMIVFGGLSFQRTKTWKNSLVLWNDVINHYPNAPVPRTNRANYFYTLAIDPAHAFEADSFYQRALEDCNVALKTEPRHQPGYQIRGLIFQKLNRFSEALADARALIRLAPNDRTGYSISSTANMNLNRPDEALADLNMCLKLKPDDDISYNNRGSIFYGKKKYPEALEDYNKAIRFNPKGNYYLNRSFCYFELGDLSKAKTDARAALQKGIAVDSSYLRSLNL